MTQGTHPHSLLVASTWPQCVTIDWRDVSRWAANINTPASSGSCYLQCCVVFTRSPADAGQTRHKNTTTLENRAGTGATPRAYQQNRQGAITSALTCTFFCLQRHNWPNWPATHSMTAACDPTPAGNRKQAAAHVPRPQACTCRSWQTLLQGNLLFTPTSCCCGQSTAHRSKAAERHLGAAAAAAVLP